MTRRKPTNVSASVRQRLMNLARGRGEEFQYILTRYGLERLLYPAAPSCRMLAAIAGMKKSRSGSSAGPYAIFRASSRRLDIARESRHDAKRLTRMSFPANSPATASIAAWMRPACPTKSESVVQAMIPG